MSALRLLLVVVVLMCSAVVTAQQADYFVEADVSTLSPYVGQTVIYSFRLYSRVSRTNQGSIVNPGFDGFWKQEFASDRKYGALIGDQNYEVKERRFALYPSYAGDISVESAAFVIPDQPDRSGEVLVTDPMTVHVRPLPETGDLAGFGGAVGQFAIEPTVDRQSTTQGEPITLRLTVRGTGNLEQLPAPDLPEMPEWRIFPDSATYRAQEVDETIVGEKIFEWLFTPLAAGQQVLPEVTFTYFDPESATYHTLSTTPFPVEIIPAAGEAVPDAASTTDTLLPLKPLPASLALDTPEPGWLLWLLWFVPPLIVGGLWFRQRQQRRRTRHAAFYRRSEALKQVKKILVSAHKAPSDDAFRLIREGIITYIADKLDVPPGSLNIQDLEAALTMPEIDHKLRSEILMCIEAADQGLYAPGTQNNATALAQHTATTLAAIDTCWENT